MLKILLTPNATQLFLCFFESKQETHNLSKKTTFCNTLLFFLWCFCKKALRVQCRKAFSIPAPVNPSGPTHVTSFHYGFLWDCMRGAARVM